MPLHVPPRAIWTALSTTHLPLSQTLGRARRYPAAVAPFGALEDSSEAAMGDLRKLLAPGESLFLEGQRPPTHPGMQWMGAVRCLQMVFPAEAPLEPPSPVVRVDSLFCSHSAEMMDLIQVAYPGYFRSETCCMGQYFGFRDPRNGRLVAMGGERLCLQEPGGPPWREISALCTHSEHAGKGLGTALLWHILAVHRAAGVHSWLWVAESNPRALELYLRSGFVVCRSAELHRVQRIAG